MRVYIYTNKLKEWKQVQVWTQETLSHSKEEEDWKDRHKKTEIKDIQWCGGEIMDWEFLENKHKTNRSAINLGDWACAYNTTDRARNPVSLASADVFHIYNLALSYMFHPPRAFSLLDTYNSQTKHPEHTTWADLLDTEGNLTAQTKPEKGKETEEPPDQQENKEYTVENILAFRWCPKEGREYYVQWKDYSGSWDTWQKENTIKHTEAFARFALVMSHILIS